MYPVYIDNHKEQMQDYLLSQFKNSPNILKYVEAYADKVQEIELEYWTLLESLGIDTATGYALDLIGKEVGEKRNSRDDTDYRAAIIVKIFINNSSGSPEEVISAAKQITGASKVKYSTFYPAGTVLEIIGAPYLPYASTIKSTLPAGVDLIFDNTLDIDTAQTYGGAAYSQIVMFESNPI